MSDLAEAPMALEEIRSPFSLETVRGWVWAWAPLALVVAGFAVLSTAYNVRVPLYEAPDERAHSRYAASLAEQGKLPKFTVVEDYESWHPPLYYALGAGVLKLLALGPVPNLEQNPNFPAQSESHLHTVDESFPYSKPVLAVHVLRGVSGLFAAGTLVFVYLITLVVFPQRRLLALSAASTTGLVPQFAFIASMVNNDAASVFFAAATVYFGLRYMRDTRPTWLFIAAIALSLGALSKSTAMIAGVVPMGVVLFSALPWRQRLNQLAVLGFLPLSMAGWFYVRSLVLWGAIFPKHLFWPLSPAPIWDPLYRTVFLEALRHSYWYAGGALNIGASPVLYDLLDLLSALALGGVIVTFVSARLSRLQRRGLLLLGLLPILALLVILYFSATADFQPQGRYLFVAQPALAILMPMGLSALFSPKGERDHPTMLALPVLLIAMNIYIFAIVLPRAY